MFTQEPWERLYMCAWVKVCFAIIRPAVTARIVSRKISTASWKNICTSIEGGREGRKAFQGVYHDVACCRSIAIFLHDVIVPIVYHGENYIFHAVFSFK